LLKAARRCFAERGFVGASNKEMAALAGITAGAIYHYYPSKAELFAAAYGDVQQQIGEAFEKAVAGASTDRLEDRLSAVIDAAVELARDDPWITALATGVAGEVQRHPELGPLVGVAQRRNNRLIVDLVGDAHAAGELADGVSVAAVIDVIGVILSGLARFNRVNQDPARHAQVSDALKLLLRAELWGRH
jgi:AcrR family transcriptional regulator